MCSQRARSPPTRFLESERPGSSTSTRFFSKRRYDRRDETSWKERANNKLMADRNKADPFLVLGVDRKDQYTAVKRAFLQLAMKHHPDTAKSQSEKEQEESREIFIAARKAFEELTEGPDGVAVLRDESDDKWEEEELNSWFRKQSGGFDMPFMDLKTMKEVAEMTEKLGGEAGLDRDGGMWTLARMVTADVANGGDGGSVLQLEAGAIRDRQIDGELRRRRRR
eukprot:CAMPEP_0172461212 /NCGR_PEP_ID=MMETSP1065-20121228/39664_1 /TAXON_ID=265537 /ORGANISM="Amphiprora paludosa, Strain CCMP125" /LENGTH=223 /DNA_ID=CAMNT_0013216463 /DNA_START=154 /DNA_END=825 /DNA_ORIENTATION=+